MKWFVALIFTFNSFFLSAQVMKFRIQGTVQDTEHARFAYLSTSSHQINISSSKIFMVTPVVNGKFEFNGTFDLDGKYYQHACIIIDDRGTISKDELASRFRSLVWVVGRESNIKHIVLEDMKLDIEGRDQANTSKILEGGTLTRQFEEEGQAVRAGDRKLMGFVKKYRDSPIALDAVQQVSDMTTLANRDKLAALWGKPSELYVLLSDRLKNTKQGLSLKKEINTFDKL
jgi:hypothetical protein